MKRSTRLIAALLSVTTLVSGSSLAAAAAEAVNADSKVYVKEMKIAYGKNEQEAKNWLSNHGFTPVNGNLNKSNGTVTVMGYKTTANVNEAITDLAVMPMGNGYSIDTYQDMLDQYKTSVIDPFIESFMPAINEYRANAAAGRPQAIAARTILNSYTDGFGIPATKPKDWDNMTDADYAAYKARFDAISAKWNDTDKALGDALADGQLRSEVTEAEYNANPREYVDLSKLILQCDPDALSAIRQALAMATDTDPNQTWIDRLEEAGPDCLTQSFADYFPSYAAQADEMTDDDKRTVISAAYEDSAKKLAAGFQGLSKELQWYDEYPVHFEDPQNKIDAHFQSVAASEGSREKAAQVMRWTNAAVLYDALNAVTYEGDWGDTLLAFFYAPEHPVDRTESYEDFYPLAAQLSNGQRAGLDFLPLTTLVAYGVRDVQSWSDTQSEIDARLENMPVTGVYANVNRELYDGGVALTSDAMRKKDLEGSDPYDSVVHSVPYRAVSYSLLGVGIVGTAVGLTVFFKAKGAAAEWAQRARQLRTDLENAVTSSQNAFKTYEKYNNVKNNMQMEGKKVVVDQNTKLSPEEFESNYKSFQENYRSLNNDVVPQARLEYEEGYELALSNAEKAKLWEKIGAGVSIACGLMAIAGGIMTIIDLATYYKPEFKEIPRYIVDEKDIVDKDENGNILVRHNDYAYYKVVTSNRKGKGTNGDADHNWWTNNAQKNVDKYTQWGCGDYADLNGDVGKGWLALYTESNPKHDPIEAGSFVVKCNDEVPTGYEEAIHLFGDNAAVNLNSSRWDFNANKTFVYYKTYALHRFSRGDVNADGNINVKDITAIQRYAAQLTELSETALAVADVTGDGSVSISDATRIQAYLAEFITLDELVTPPTK